MSSMTLDVDASRFLAHLPQFFSSLGNALAEQLQNSTRAGASAVDITLKRTPEDDAWMVIVRDDGPGVDDPSNLFVAARTGWDETTVVEPAGMGFYALLGLAERLTIVSRLPDGSGWTATVTASAFRGEAFDVVPLDVSDAPPGLTLEAVLKPEADIRPLLRRQMWEGPPAWRHAYPLTVTIHRPGPDGTLETEELPSRMDAVVAKWVALETSVGTLYGDTQRRDTARYLHVVWEHRLISVDYMQLTKALPARHGKLGGDIASALPRDIIWVLPGDTAVRPQLPERSAIIANTAWHEAVNALADALVQAFEFDRIADAVRQLAQTLPDVTVNNHRGAPATAALPFTSVVVPRIEEAGAAHPFFVPDDQHWMTWAGYRSIILPDPFDTSGDWEGENANGYYGSQQNLWMKNVPVTEDPAHAAALNWHGFWTLIGEPQADEAALEVQARDLAWAPGDLVDGWIQLGRASAINVLRDGVVIGTLPWLTSPDTSDVFGENNQLIMADRDEGLGYDNDVILPIPYLLMESDSQSFWEYVYGGEPDLGDLEAAVIQRARETWDVAAAARQVAVNRAHERQQRLSTLLSEAKTVLPLLEDDPVLSELLTHLVEQIAGA